MTISAVERLFGWPAMSLAGAVVLVVAGGTGGEARPGQAAVTNAHASVAQAGTVQPQKPARLRYFGGPKSPMFLE